MQQFFGGSLVGCRCSFGWEDLIPESRPLNDRSTLELLMK